MSSIKHHFKALHGALGVKRYILGSVVLFVISLYKILEVTLPKYGIHFLPKLPTWEIAIGLILLFIVWWLLQRVVALETEIEPKLDIQFEEGPPFELTEPMQINGHAQRFYRVKIKNKSIINLSDCLVVLEEIRAQDGKIYPNRYVPVGLTTDHQFLEKRKRGVFNLRGKQSKFVVVAIMDETKSDSEITFLYADENYPNMIPRGTYILSLSVYGGGLPVRKDFKIMVDDNGYLRMNSQNEKLA